MAHNSLFSKLQAYEVTSHCVVEFPKNGVVRDIILRNTTENAVMGGIRIGTETGMGDVIKSFPVGAGAFLIVPDALIMRRSFSTIDAQPLIIDAISGWNGASLNIDIIYYQL